MAALAGVLASLSTTAAIIWGLLFLALSGYCFWIGRRLGGPRTERLWGSGVAKWHKERSALAGVLFLIIAVALLIVGLTKLF
ncbi:MAG: hypothetical protein WB565_10445 [Acidimicrobiales bacterium]